MSCLPVGIISRERRKRTIQAPVVAGTIRVMAPAGVPHDEERPVVDDLAAKIRRKLQAGTIDLAERASPLAGRFGLPEPTEIEWSNRQNARWDHAARSRAGSASPTGWRRSRISSSTTCSSPNSPT
ncbi:MAG TPA: hypothetical protein VLB85_05395 [Acidimicrobiia bacterium]|nr:hypothetical protein [Acidimicrobiia bacterium]